MDFSYPQIASGDVFFYYGEPGSNLDLETQSDLIAGMVQSKRTLFYNRQDSAGVAEKENMPNGVILGILTRFDIANWNAYRNTQVSDGTVGADRRVSISQNSIDVLKNEKGELDINVNYIPFVNIRKVSSVNLPVARGV
jgi:hypothetical protein